MRFLATFRTIGRGGPVMRRMPSRCVAGAVGLALLLLAGCGDSSLTTTPSGLQYKDLEVGTGPEAKKGDQVEVHYTGWLRNGTKFDSSHDHDRPFTFTLGQHKVIPGWDEGVQGMKVGGKRKLLIPPKLGYGEQGSPPKIPPNSELTFEIELLAVYRHVTGGLYVADLAEGTGP